jgi:anti-anti-sigma regulatory factor
MPALLDETETVPLLRIEGEADITTALELKALLLKALAAGKGLRVSLEKAIDLDITAMQLLVATERDAAKSGTPFSIEGRVPDDVSVAMAHAGFRKFAVPAGAK